MKHREMLYKLIHEFNLTFKCIYLFMIFCIKMYKESRSVNRFAIINGLSLLSIP